MMLSSKLPTILLRTSLRYLLRHPWQIGLCILGVALGVAVVVAIDLANTSALRAFTLSTEAIAGKATHQIVGSPNGLDESLYRRVRVDLGIRPAAPIVEDYVNAPTLGDITLQLLGIDPLAEPPFRSYLGSAGLADASTDVDLSALLVEPATVLISEDLAQRYRLRPGDPLDVRVGSDIRTVQIIGLIQPTDELSRRALENVLIMDIASAQEVLGLIGKISRIDLILGETSTVDIPNDPQAQIEEITAVLPPGAEVTRPQARSNTLEQMTQAFQLNLTALSLLALVVGMFLIYNTITFSVVQRRSLIGTLRCIGVTRRQIFGLVLGEAMLISIVGSLIGLGLGVLLGQGLVVLVTRTINDLYFVVTVRSLEIAPIVLLKGLLLGIGATLVAAAVPAQEATYAPPRAALSRSSVEERVRNTVPLALGGGIALLVIGGTLLLLPEVFPNTEASVTSIVLAFVALFFILIGCALLTPGITVGLMRLARPLLGRLFGLLGRMAARDVVAALSRTSIAIAALMIAVSVTIGVGIMVGSFRQTVITWLDQSLVADIYVSSPSNSATRADTTLDPAIAQEFAQTPGIVDVTLLRNVQVDTPSGPTTLVAIKRPPERRGGQRFKQGNREEAWRAFDQGAVFISEPLAYRTGLGVGDQLPVRTDEGMRDFPIAGVYYDYTSDRGVLQIDYETYRTYWNDTAISSFALYCAPGTNIDKLVQQFRVRAGELDEALLINSNRDLRVNTLAIFDRTFAITAVLQVLAMVVAFIGILSALMALQLERARELGMLRANGLTPRQLWGVIFSQTGLMGLTAGLLAIPVGIILAIVLVYVINRRSFGWTLELALDPLLFAQALAVAVTAAVLAGIYPALRMGRTNPAVALREE